MVDDVARYRAVPRKSISRSKPSICRKRFEGLYEPVRDQLGHDPVSGHLPYLPTNQDAIESSGVGRQRLVGVRETPGEGTVSDGRKLEGRPSVTMRSEEVGDAGERSGCRSKPGSAIGIAKARKKPLAYFSTTPVRNRASFMAAADPHKDASRHWKWRCGLPAANCTQGAVDHPKERCRDSAVAGSGCVLRVGFRPASEIAERSATGVADRTKSHPPRARKQEVESRREPDHRAAPSASPTRAANHCPRIFRASKK